MSQELNLHQERERRFASANTEADVITATDVRTIYESARMLYAVDVFAAEAKPAATTCVLWTVQHDFGGAAPLATPQDVEALVVANPLNNPRDAWMLFFEQCFALYVGESATDVRSHCWKLRQSDENWQRKNSPVGRVIFSKPGVGLTALTPVSNSLFGRPATASGARGAFDRHIETAKRLVAQYFGSQTQVAINNARDPETDEELLEVAFVVSGKPEEILDTYDKVTREWVAKVPAAVRQHIRLAYEVTD